MLLLKKRKETGFRSHLSEVKNECEATRQKEEEQQGLTKTNERSAYYD